MPNKDIQINILSSGIMKWQIAEAMGIADTTFSKWLRKELSIEKKSAILLAIQNLKHNAKNR